MENQSTTARGLRGLFSGLRTGILMMGIFTLVSAAVLSSGVLVSAGLLAAGTAIPTFTGALMSVLPGAAIGVIATSLFGAVNAATSSAPARETVQIRGRDGVMRTAQITQGPAVAMPIITAAPAVAAEHAPTHEHTPEQAQAQGSWTERVGHGHQTRIADILANGSMSDKDRAAALLAERSQTSTDHGRA